MDLQAKRADLVAQIEQFVGQINRTNGAIALIDDLLLEEAQKEAEPPTLGGINRDPNPMWQPASASPDWVQGEVKEMPQVQFDDEQRVVS